MEAQLPVVLGEKRGVHCWVPTRGRAPQDKENRAPGNSSGPQAGLSVLRLPLRAGHSPRLAGRGSCRERAVFPGTASHVVCPCGSFLGASSAAHAILHIHEAHALPAFPLLRHLGRDRWRHNQTTHTHTLSPPTLHRPLGKCSLSAPAPPPCHKLLIQCSCDTKPKKGGSSSPQPLPDAWNGVLGSSGPWGEAGSSNCWPNESPRRKS